MKLHYSPTTGDIETCRAKKGNCPYGSEEDHFTSREEAEKYRDFVNKRRSSGEIIMQRMLKNNSVVATHNLSETRQIYDFAFSKMKGKMESFFLTKNGDYIDSMGKEIKSKKIKDKIENAKRKVEEKYKKIGYTEEESRDTDIQSIHFSKEDPDFTIVHNGGSNVLDGCVLNHGKVKIIEAKNTGCVRGARLFLFSTTVNSKGNVQPPRYVSDDIKEKIKNFSIDSVDSDVFTIPTSKHEAIRYFIEGYRAKGADAFLYSTPHGDSKEIVFEGKSEEEIIKSFEKENLNVEIQTELKKSTMPITDERAEVIKHKLKTKNNKITKDVFDREESIKLRTVKYKENGEYRESYGFGPFVIPLDKKEDFEKGKEIDMLDLLEKRVALRGRVSSKRQ